MFTVAIRKMKKNIWMAFCLLLGCLLSVALISSLYTYSDAILNRMVMRSYEQRQIEDGVYPLVYSVKHRYMTGNNELTEESYQSLTKQAQEYYNAIGVPNITYRESFKFTDLYLRHLSLYSNNDHSENNIRFTLSSLAGINDHIEIIAGRRPQPTKVKNEYEVIVNQTTMYAFRLSLDSRYEVPSIKDLSGNPLIISVVGVFEPIDEDDPFWFGQDYNSVQLDPDVYDNSIYIELAGSKKAIITCYVTYSWNYALDYKTLTSSMVDSLVETIDEQTAFVRVPLSISLSNYNLLENFSSQRQQIYIFLLVLLIPIIALLAFFIVMISGLVFEYDKNERTLIRSRGGRKSQVFIIYVFQSTIISLISIGLGVPLSLLFCRLIGSANGFLEFVNRTPLAVTVSFWSIIYAILGLLVFLFSMLLPLALTREDSIVLGKRKNLRFSKTFFDRYYIDVIMLTLAGIGLYTYENISRIMTEAGISAEDTPINPFLFITSSLFIFGCCLLFARVYPRVIELIFKIGRQSWSPVIYSSLINTSRVGTRGRFLMVFLVATVSMGIFSSAAARTINQNTEDRISYQIGADIVLREKWESIDPDPQFTPEGNPVQKDEKDLLFLGEPSFEKYLNLEGVKEATKVYTNSRVQLRQNGRIHKNINVMCIVPNEFIDVAWYRNDLYPYSMNYMMNAMIINPYMVLVSENLMDRLGLVSGDIIGIRWDNNKEVINCTVYDKVRYFPSYDPSILDENGEAKELIIMNYQLIERLYRKEPYEVWLSLEDGYPSYDIYQQLIEKDIPLLDFKGTSSEIVVMKNDPSIQGMNGILTLSFLVTVIITVSGFLIYWVFDIKKRQLHLAIIRSMGMSGFKIITILLWEQLLMSFIPMLAGLSIGGLSANIFVPMFDFGVTATEAVPPYKVFIVFADYLRIGLIVVIAILLAMIILGVMISRIKISQTLKLGEE